MSGYQVSAFGLGQIKAHLYHGLAPYAISGHNMGLLRAETHVKAQAFCILFWVQRGPPEDRDTWEHSNSVLRRSGHNMGLLDPRHL